MRYTPAPMSLCRHAEMLLAATLLKCDISRRHARTPVFHLHISPIAAMSPLRFTPLRAPLSMLMFGDTARYTQRTLRRVQVTAQMRQHEVSCLRARMLAQDIAASRGSACELPARFIVCCVAANIEPRMYGARR